MFSLGHAAAETKFTMKHTRSARVRYGAGKRFSLLAEWESFATKYQRVSEYPSFRGYAS